MNFRSAKATTGGANVWPLVQLCVIAVREHSPTDRMNLKEHVFTLGIEEEFQIIDPHSRELCDRSKSKYLIQMHHLEFGQVVGDAEIANVISSVVGRQRLTAGDRKSLARTAYCSRRKRCSNQRQEAGFLSTGAEHAIASPDW
jgi:hypothetical protein